MQVKELRNIVTPEHCQNIAFPKLTLKDIQIIGTLRNILQHVWIEMPNGKIYICLDAITMLIHPQLDGTLEGLQVVLQYLLFLTNDGLHSTSDVLYTMRKKFLFIVVDELHGSTTTKQGVKQRIITM